jgi:hypothetical protein
MPAVLVGRLSYAVGHARADAECALPVVRPHQTNRGLAGALVTRNGLPVVRAARDWASFAYAASANRAAPLPAAPIPATELRALMLGPLMYCGLAAREDERARVFLADYRHALTANTFRLAQAATVRDALAQAGMEPVLIKGGAFLVRFGTAHPGIRPMSDLDMLVAGDQFHAAARVLSGLGFAPVSDAFPASRRLAPARGFVRHHGAMRVDLDLHRAVAQWPIARDLRTAVLREAERVGGWSVPSLASSFGLTALHRARHGYLWSCLDLLDLKRMADAMDDDAWQAAMDTSRRCRLDGAVYAAFRQAAWWFGERAADGDRLARLRRRLGALSRHLIDRMAPVEGPLMPDAVWNRPLVRNLVVMPCATGTPARAWLAMATFLPLRLADECLVAGRAQPRAGGLLPHLWKHVVRGADPTAGARSADRVPAIPAQAPERLP